MNSRQALAGMFQIFAVFLLFGAGFFFTCIPFRPELAVRLSEYIATRPDLCIWTGISFFCLSLLFSFGFYAATKGRYLLLNLGGNLVRIDSKIVHQTIAPSLNKQFAKAIRLHDVEIMQGNHLELRVMMDLLEPKEQKKLLLEAEAHLIQILSEKFGYHKKFTLQVLQA